MKLNLRQPSSPSTAVRSYADILIEYSDRQPVISRMRGSSQSNVLMIAPPSLKEDAEQNLPLVSPAAAVFHNILLNVKFNTEKDCLIVAGSWWGNKPLKASYEPTIKFIKAFAQCVENPKFICVGNLNFKFLFGGGKKPSDETLAGATIYPRETLNKPLFYFPDIAPLAPEETDNDRERYFREQYANRHGLWLQRLLPKFTKFLLL